MIKMSVLKWMFFLILILGSYPSINYTIAEDIPKDKKITKISPKENSTDKILFIKNQFEKNKKYTTIEDENTFKDVLIGVWGAPPQGIVEFKSNGQFESKNDYEENKFPSGFWEFHDGVLRISLDKKKWKTYKIIEYELSFQDISHLHKYGRNWDSGSYTFSISFDNRVCGMSRVLTISFHTK